MYKPRAPNKIHKNSSKNQERAKKYQKIMNLYPLLSKLSAIATFCRCSGEGRRLEHVPKPGKPQKRPRASMGSEFLMQRDPPRSSWGLAWQSSTPVLSQRSV